MKTAMPNVMCDYCKQVMDPGVSCTQKTYSDFQDGITRLRLPSYIPHNCPDCNAPTGGLHHPGCHNEICPLCEWQAISCGCGIENEDDEDEYIVVFHDNELSKEIRRNFQTMSLGPFSIAEPSEDSA